MGCFHSEEPKMGTSEKLPDTWFEVSYEPGQFQKIRNVPVTEHSLSVHSENWSWRAFGTHFLINKVSMHIYIYSDQSEAITVEKSMWSGSNITFRTDTAGVLIHVLYLWTGVYVSLVMTPYLTDALSTLLVRERWTNYHYPVLIISVTFVNVRIITRYTRIVSSRLREYKHTLYDINYKTHLSPLWYSSCLGWN